VLIFQRTKHHDLLSIERLKEQRTTDEYERLINAPDPDCPMGHVKVDEEQRRTTLEQLKLSTINREASWSPHIVSLDRAALEMKLSHLPIRNDSLTLRRTKEELQKKIVESDEAIEIFSKPKVFIRVTDWSADLFVACSAS
jgi:hypothetical protein